jgi:hypothetical protein
VNAISDDDLLVAYCGWAWLFPALQAECRDGIHVSDRRGCLSRQEAQRWAGEPKVHRPLQDWDSELFEFTATKNGRQIKGAGDTNSEVSYDQDDPRFNLPSIYFLLGQTCINSIR